MKKLLHEYQIVLNIKAEHAAPQEDYGSWSYKASFLSLEFWAPASCLPPKELAWEKRPKTFTKQEHLSVGSTHNFEPGEKAYIVLVGCGSGDSFGSSYNSTWEAVHVFKRCDLALLLAQEIVFDYACKNIEQELNPKKNQNKVSKIQYLNDDLKKQNFFTEIYQGYFEHLTHVGVYEAPLQTLTQENVDENKYDIVFLATSLPLYRTYDWITTANRAGILAKQEQLRLQKEKILLNQKIPQGLTLKKDTKILKI